MSSHGATPDLGAYGVWARANEITPELAGRCEEWGYGAIWVGGSPGGDLAVVETLLDATERIPVATGIVNMWRDPAPAIAAAFRRLESRHPGRFLLGVGIGHPESTTGYSNPYDTMVEYLDTLAGEGVPIDRIVLAALGPRALKLSSRKAAGAHPYLTTPAHTRLARERIGPGALLAPEQTVVMSQDPVLAEELARAFVARYTKLGNYRASLIREGWSETDLADGGSDALVGALVLRGDVATIAAGIREHLAAGADHVPIQVLDDDRERALSALIGLTHDVIRNT
jgi:probable F420-dependent oxidoreductase